MRISTPPPSPKCNETAWETGAAAGSIGSMSAGRASTAAGVAVGGWLPTPSGSGAGLESAGIFDGAGIVPARPSRGSSIGEAAALAIAAGRPAGLPGGVRDGSCRAWGGTVFCTVPLCGWSAAAGPWFGSSSASSGARQHTGTSGWRKMPLNANPDLAGRISASSSPLGFACFGFACESCVSTGGLATVGVTVGGISCSSPKLRGNGTVGTAGSGMAAGAVTSSCKLFSVLGERFGADPSWPLPSTRQPSKKATKPLPAPRGALPPSGPELLPAVAGGSREVAITVMTSASREPMVRQWIPSSYALRRRHDLAGDRFPPETCRSRAMPSLSLRWLGIRLCTCIKSQ